MMNAFILSPKKADKKVPLKPPSAEARKICTGDKLSAMPAGMAAYISNVAKAATVKNLMSIFKVYGLQQHKTNLIKAVYYVKIVVI